MPCSGCKKRSDLVGIKMSLSIGEKRYFERNGMNVPFVIESFLNKNKKLMMNESKSKKINYNNTIVKTGDKRQIDLVNNMISSDSIYDVLPLELSSVITPVGFNPFKSYSVLSYPIGEKEIKMMLKVEKSSYNDLITAISRNDDHLEYLSNRYFDCLFNLFLMTKKTLT